jgi:hypothetical protein
MQVQLFRGKLLGDQIEEVLSRQCLVNRSQPLFLTTREVVEDFFDVVGEPLQIGAEVLFDVSRVFQQFRKLEL